MLNPNTQLKNQRIIATRPAGKNTKLLKLLQQAGADAVALPLIEIKPTTSSDSYYQVLKQQIMNLDNYHFLIFISPNAANLAKAWIDQYWPQLPVDIQWLAVGKATAITLTELDVDVHYPTTGQDSEALLAMPMLQPQQVRNKKVLILRGQSGRETLAQELGARGAKVSYAELYQRVCPDYSQQEITDILYSQPLNAILITSGAGLDNLVKLLKITGQFSLGSLDKFHLIVPSERIQQQAHNAGFNRVTLANSANDYSMVAALMQ